MVRGLYNNAYAQCRLNPFSNHGSFTGIPDGANSRRLIVDHKAYTDFQVTSGTWTLRITPFLASGACISFSSGTTFSATDSQTTASGTWGTSSNQWLPICGYPEFSSTNRSPASSSEGPYSQVKCRLVGQAWRLIYTGPVTSAQGLLTVRSFPISIGTNFSSVPFVSQQLNTNTGTSPAGSFNSGTALTGGVLCDFPSPNARYPADAMLFRADENPHGILKSNLDIFPWTDYCQQPIMIFSSSSYTTSNIAGSTSGAQVSPIHTVGTDTAAFGVNAIADNFTCTEIASGNAVGANVTFRIEVKACWEYIVQPTSPIATLTKQPPVKNQKVLDLVAQKEKTLPVAVPNSKPIGGS